MNTKIDIVDLLVQRALDDMPIHQSPKFSAMLKEITADDIREYASVWRIKGLHGTNLEMIYQVVEGLDDD